MTIKQINSLSAEIMTKIVQAKFGPEFYAVAFNGHRCIAQRIGLCIDDVRCDTWVEALAAAYAKWPPVSHTPEISERTTRRPTIGNCFE